MGLTTKLITGLVAFYGLAKLFQDHMKSWGSKSEERALSLPGEKALEKPRIATTHAITINAAASQIWPWLVQIGVGRGGFYSYSWLENLFGCEVQNVDRIVPEFQNLREGDFVYLHPKAAPLKVTHIEKNKSLALEGWMFELKPLGPNSTRLIARTYALPPRKVESLPWKFFDMAMNTVWYDLAHFIMERKQLKEIKRLVERPRLETGAAIRAFQTGSEDRGAVSGR